MNQKYENARNYVNLGSLLINIGNQNLEKGSIETAIQLYIESLKEFDINYNEFCQRGNYFKELGNSQSRINEFLAFYKFQNIVDVAKYLKGPFYDILGVAHERIKQSEIAISILTDIVQSYPLFSFAYLDRGKALWFEGKFEAAIIDYTKCIELTPDEISVYYYRGISNLRGNKLEALFDFNKYVLLLEQQRVDLRNDRGMFVNACAIQIMQKNEEKALTLLTTTIIINPNFGLAYLYRGLIFQQNNKMKEANDDFKQAINFYPKHFESYYYLCTNGSNLVTMELYEEGIQVCSKVIDLKPDLSDLYYARAYAYMSLKRKQEALKDFLRAVELNYKNPAECYEYIGKIQYFFSQFEPAFESYGRAIQLNPKSFRGYFGRGLIQSDRGNTYEAIADYTKAIELNPNLAQAYNNRARIYDLLGKKEAAIQDYNTAFQLEPDNPVYLANKGVIFIAENKLDLAMVHLEKADQIIKTNPMQYLKDKFLLDELNIAFILDKISIVKKIKNQLKKAENIINENKEQSKQNDQIISQIEQLKAESSKEILKHLSQEQNNSDLMKLLDDLLKRIEYFENELKQIKDLDPIKIETELQKLNENQANYFKSFYWRLINYLNACQYLSTGLLQGNNNSVNESTPEKIAQQINEGLEKGAIVASLIPVAGDFIEIVNSVFDWIHNEYKEKKLVERIKRLSNLIQKKTLNLENEIKIAGLSLAQDLTTEKLNQKFIQQEQFSNYRRQISQAEEKQNISDALDLYWQLGIEHCLIVLIHFENKSSEILEEKKPLSKIVIEAVLTPFDYPAIEKKKKSQIQPNQMDQEKEKYCCSCQ